MADDLRALFPGSFGGKKHQQQSQKQQRKAVGKPGWMDEDDDDAPKLSRPAGMDSLLAQPPSVVEPAKLTALPPMNRVPPKEKKAGGLNSALHPMLLQPPKPPAGLGAVEPKATAERLATRTWEEEEDDDEDMCDGAVGDRDGDSRPMPAKPEASADDEEDEDDDIGPPPPPKGTGEDDDSDDEDLEDDNEPDVDVLPVSQQIKLSDHRRTVSAVTLDPAGSRIVTGGRDCTVKMWDFNGMDTRFRPFRTIDEPCGGNPIRDLQYSLSGDSFLIASGNAQAKLYDREGTAITEFVKGDPYLRDMKHTKGHVAAMTGCRWHPQDKQIFLTASLDSTVRIWDVDKKRDNVGVIINKSKERGGRTGITAACYSPDGRTIACAGHDGEMRLWDSKAPYIQPAQRVEKAHLPGNVISSLNISLDNQALVSRGMDDTLKLWDLRKLKSPVASVSDLPNMFEETNAIFSPNNRQILTGVSINKGETTIGRIKVFDKTTLEFVRDVEVGPGSIVRVLWHGRINQILATSSDGALHVMYDQNVSAYGAKLCAGRVAKGRAVDDLSYLQDDSARVIINPHALPMFKEDVTHAKTKRKLARLRADAIATRKPDQPISGPGKGGKVGSSSTQGMLKVILKDTMRDEDPREAILKHADAAASNPLWIAPAYKKNQPDVVMHSTVFEDEVEEQRANKKQRPK
ncbi:hypothetical protein HK101_000710 [Irineochytrium annulatum]|nr:hypothetical protein HK101_000710 [Irineochytrium annulatum]